MVTNTTIEKLSKVVNELIANHTKLEEKANKQIVQNDILFKRQGELLETFKYCAIHLAYYYLTHDISDDVLNAVDIMSNWVYNNYNEIEC